MKKYIVKIKGRTYKFTTNFPFKELKKVFVKEAIIKEDKK